MTVILPPERPRQCHHAVHHTHIASIPCHSQRSRLTPGHGNVLLDAARRTIANIVHRHDGRQRGWSSAVAGADLTLMSLHAAYYFFLQNRYRRSADTNSPMFWHAPMLPIFDVYISRTLIESQPKPKIFKLVS